MNEFCCLNSIDTYRATPIGRRLFRAPQTSRRNGLLVNLCTFTGIYHVSYQ